MAIWKDSNTQRQAAPAPSAPEAPDTHRMDLNSRAEPAPVVPVNSNARPGADRARAESIIAADIMIEGKIEGSGSVRIAGRFKGDVNVQGDLTIEAGAKLTGGVRADKVTIAGELEGNIEGATQASLLAPGVNVGDVKCGNMTVASGARMRGVAEFGWDEKSGKKGFGSETAGNA